jgi:hypothetical protein
MGDQPQGAADRLQAGWPKHQKAAPFKRNNAMLAVLPIGVMVFPGTGIQANLADKAKKLGISVWKFGDEVAPAKVVSAVPASRQDHTAPRAEAHS